MKNIIQNILLVLSVIVLAASCYNEDNRILESCADQIMNQDETGIDCGGTVCDPCPPSCDNGILDYVDGWQETGIDCGGPCLELGQDCCTNGVLDQNEFDPTLSENWVDCKFDGLGPGEEGSNSQCDICPTCENGVHDAGEEITIGGVVYDVIDCDDDPNTDCPLCVDLCNDGLLNGFEMPCVDCGGVCPNCNADHCTNGTQDTFGSDPYSSETAIDCGGCACPPCALLCGDGILNGSEVAIDCGGNDCPTCIDPVLCGDGIQNGYETAIDCYDGTDGASACPPCQTLCDNGIQDGNETDTDCGGDVCGPCGNDEVGYLTYEVDGVLYESVFTSISATRFPGNAGAPTDGMTVVGGVNHPVSLTIYDVELPFNNWGTNDNLISNVPIPLVNSFSFTDIDGQVYTGESDPNGINFNITSIQYTAPPPTPPGTPGGTIEAEFSGVVYNSFTGESKIITNGQLKTTFVN